MDSRETIVILGSGESGVGAALLAKAKGFEVFVSDFGKIKENFRQELQNAAIEWEEGGHSEDKVLKAATVIKSPGIPEKAAIIKKIRKQNIELISEIEFASRYTKGKIIAITGSNGKTTTATLTHHILKNAGLDVALVGNVGKSFARQIVESDKANYVIEVSSFQLDDTISFKPNIAVILNITPDHLDRYDYDLQKYIEAKLKIAQYQSVEDQLIYCMDDENIAEQLKQHPVKTELIPFTIKKKAWNTGHISTTSNYLLI